MVPVANRKPLPPWFKIEIAQGRGYRKVNEVLSSLGLDTVCQSARCPNRGRCFSQGRVTFLLLGNVCTRSCSFCAVAKGSPPPLDGQEPFRLAEAVRRLNLRRAVITSVTRDDLPDGGAAHFRKTVEAIRSALPSAQIEVMTPDFQGLFPSVAQVLEARPQVFSHNLETVPRLYPRVRSGADYHRSLQVLRWAREVEPALLTKSGLMVGLGEGRDELLGVMADLRAVGCDILTLGQYLQPTPAHLPVARFVPPQEFAWLKREGERMGFSKIVAGPLVRSSLEAEAP